MTRMKAWMAELLVALVVVAGFGFGLVAMGFALVAGLVITLALRLVGPHLRAEAEKRAAGAPVRRAQGRGRDADPNETEHAGA